MTEPLQAPILPAPEGALPIRVLIVDDSRLQLRIMRSILEKQGYHVTEALSGADALEKCHLSSPDMVVSDWMMPGMDGLEFCRLFRAIPNDSYGYFILLTSKSETGDIANGLDAGADDFLTKPVNPAELRARLNAGARIVSMQRELSEKNRQISDALSELQIVHEAIDKDLRQARTIQQSLVPERSRVFGKSRVSLLLEPCGHVGGDLVGMFSPCDGRLGVYSIDVSGHGITSAMVTARVAGYMSSTFPDQNIALRKTSEDHFEMRLPEQVAVMLNDRLSADPGVEEYLTMAYVDADLTTGTMRMVQAGHSPPLVLRADGTCLFLGEGGLPIGLVDDVDYDGLTCMLNSGDRLLLYSDGFTEAVLKTREMLGEEGLAEMFRAAASQGQGTELLADMFWRLREAMEEGDTLGDDVSAALLEYNILP